MPMRNEEYFLRKAYILSQYIAEDENVSRCLIDLIDSKSEKKCIEYLNEERKSLRLDWRNFYSKKMDEWFGEEREKQKN
jgi:hypothetical protein